MGRLIACPVPKYDGTYPNPDRPEEELPIYFVELPDEWLGRHILERDKTFDEFDRLPEKLSGTVRDFALSLALVDDWNLPGIGRRAATDLENLPSRFADLSGSVINWVILVVLSDFGKTFVIPKERSSRFIPGSNPTPEAARTGGDITTTK